MAAIYDLDTFAKTEFFTEAKEMCEAQGIALGGIEYKHDVPSKYSGSYLVVCPDMQYIRDLRENPAMIEKLIDQKEQYGELRFNPYYFLVDFSDYNKDNRIFASRAELARAIQYESVIINAYREFDFDRFPTVMDISAVSELHEMDVKRHDDTLPFALKENYHNGYKDFVYYLYERYGELESELKSYQKSRAQIVDVNYFEREQVPAAYDMVNDDFLQYLMLRIHKYPGFKFNLPERPDIVLPDVAKVAKKALGKDHKLFANKKKEQYYTITFPAGMQDVFYKIMLQYNTRMYQGQVKNINELTPPYKTFMISTHDLVNYDSLAKANGVKYYINHGDLTKNMGSAETRNITIAYSEKDGPMNFAICKRISEELVKALPVDHSRVSHNHNKIAARPPQHYNPVLIDMDIDR